MLAFSYVFLEIIYGYPNHICVSPLPFKGKKMDSYHISCYTGRFYLPVKVHFGLLLIVIYPAHSLFFIVQNAQDYINTTEFKSSIDCSLDCSQFSLAQTVVQSASLPYIYLYTLFKYIRNISP